MSAVKWILPFMVLDFEVYFAFIIGFGGIYGLCMRVSSIGEFVRDISIALVIFAFAMFGLKSDHSVIGLIGIELATIVAVIIYSSAFGKLNDMAPFGHLTAISILNGLLVFSAILTSEL